MCACVLVCVCVCVCVSLKIVCTYLSKSLLICKHASCVHVHKYVHPRTHACDQERYYTSHH